MAQRAMTTLRASLNPVAIGSATSALAPRQSASGSSPTVNPPAARVPRDTAAITPPLPPQTTVSPIRPGAAERLG